MPGTMENSETAKEDDVRLADQITMNAALMDQINRQTREIEDEVNLFQALLEAKSGVNLLWATRAFLNK